MAPLSLLPPPSALLALSSHLLRVFLGIVTLTSFYNGRRLFLEPTGRSHRLAGLAHLLCIVAGALSFVAPPPSPTITHSWAHQCLFYDICLAIHGTAATLTAARAFPHKTLVNAPGQSGTLNEHAYVTQSEMIEHSFYQMLNLIQAIYLHSVTWLIDVPKPQRRGDDDTSTVLTTLWPILVRLAAVWMVTAPWLFRHRFPVNSFSANWIATSEQEQKEGISDTSKMNNSWLETKLYQIKKWQYVFYKHTILHGLNVSVAFPAVLTSTTGPEQRSDIPLPLSSSWRIFWICLNASYVMEFYLQSLVKRRYISQRSMLGLQRMLMVASSLSALLAVKGVVRPEICIVSVVMNFTNRGHDVINVMIVAILASV